MIFFRDFIVFVENGVRETAVRVHFGSEVLSFTRFFIVFAYFLCLLGPSDLTRVGLLGLPRPFLGLLGLPGLSLALLGSPWLSWPLVGSIFDIFAGTFFRSI